MAGGEHLRRTPASARVGSDRLFQTPPGATDGPGDLNRLQNDLELYDGSV